MKRALALLGFAICAGFSHFPVGAADPAKADPAKGQSIANKVCAACHGADGNSPTPANPKLAGQIPEYLQKQLANFKPAAGKKADRESPIMGGMVSTLSVEDMRDVAAYYAAQQLKPGALKDKDTLELGRKIWRGGDVSKGLPACAACHGANGAGLPAQYPRLAGQYAEYTETQLKAFRSGERRNDANRMMQAIAASRSPRLGLEAAQAARFFFSAVPSVPPPRLNGITSVRPLFARPTDGRVGDSSGSPGINAPVCAFVSRVCSLAGKQWEKFTFCAA